MIRNLWIFKERVGRRIIKGKSHYPDSIQLSITRQTAFDIAERIIGFYAKKNNEKLPFQIYLPGLLEADNDE